jgi:RNA polymerase sigma-70 factor (ECF subfamily)
MASGSGEPPGTPKVTKKVEAVLREVPRLRRYAVALLADRGRADDLVQDTLERALSRLHLWQSGTDMRRWLFTIMHNLHVNAVRRSIRRGNEANIDDVEDRLVQAPSQTDSVVVRDLQRAMAELPTEQVEVLILVALEGMAYREVAEVLDIPLGTVMSRLSRARQSLRKYLDGEESPALRRVK